VVPTLTHDGRVIVDSSVINEYLEEVFPQTLLMPGDAYGRAYARGASTSMRPTLAICVLLQRLHPGKAGRRCLTAT
jgi:hypothetical protein